MLFIGLLTTYHAFAQKVNLERGLIAYYPFNADANDQSGNNLNGTVTGAQLHADVRCGDGAYEFDGNDHIDFGHNDNFNMPFRGLTVSFLFQWTDQAPEDFQLLLGKWAFNAERDQFAAFLTVQEKLSFSVADGEEFGYGIYSKTKIEPYEWYHVVLVWNRSKKMGIFVNGELDRIGEQKGDGFNTDSEVSLKAGRQIVGQDRPYTGFLDEIRIYNRSLSIEEIRALYRLDTQVCNQFTLKGYVRNKNTDEPIAANIIFTDLESGDEFININSDGETGYYETKLPIGYHYGFQTKAEDFISIEQNDVSTENVKHNAVIEKNIYLIPLEVGGTVELENIFFEFNKATLKEESFPELDRVLELFELVPGLRVEIAGHTDSRGGDDYNLKLSTDRAMAVREYLLQNNVDSARVEARGYGETVPVASNDTDEGRQQNRRVEFKILSKGDDQ